MRAGRDKQRVLMLFNEAHIPKNCPFPLVDLHPHLIHGSFGPQTQPPNGISIGSAVCTVLTNVSNRQDTYTDTDKTHRPTDHATPLSLPKNASQIYFEPGRVHPVVPATNHTLSTILLSFAHMVIHKNAPVYFYSAQS